MDNWKNNMEVSQHVDDFHTQICNEVIDKVNGSPEDLIKVSDLLREYAELDIATALAEAGEVLK